MLPVSTIKSISPYMELWQPPQMEAPDQRFPVMFDQRLVGMLKREDVMRYSACAPNCTSKRANNDLILDFFFFFYHPFSLTRSDVK